MTNVVIEVNERKKPTVVLLRDHLQNVCGEVATCIGNAGHYEVPALRSNEKTPNTEGNWEKIVELDEDMSNNFEWLLKFDLRSIYLYDIDESTQGDKKLNCCPRDQRNGKLPSKCRKSKSCETNKKNIRYTYTQMIAQCLKDLGECSVKRIYHWIEERYSSYKSLDINWKNAVRHTLSTSPLFQKRKVNSRKPYVWCLNESHVKNKKIDIIAQSTHNEEVDVNGKQRVWSSESLTNHSFDVIEKYEFQNTSSINDLHISGSAPITVLQEIWLPMNSGSQVETNFDSKLYNTSDYYELQAPKLESELLIEAAAYEEPLEITFLLNEVPLIEI